MGSHDLTGTYLRFDDTGTVDPLVVDATFWEDITSGRRTDLDTGWMVGDFGYSEDWDMWERHPAGDEIVYLVAGRVTMVLDEANGERTVELNAGTACVVPRNVWHRALVHEAGHAVHITLGQGTEHRPLKPEQ